MQKPVSTRSSPFVHRTGDLNLLLQVTGAANRSSDVKEITESTLGVLSQAVPYDLAFFLLVNSHAHRLELASPRNVPPAMIGRLERISLPKGFYEQVQDSEYGAYSLSDLVTQVREVLCDSGFENPVTVPLLAEHKGMGILALGLKSEDFSVGFLGHADLLDSVGTSVGLALMRAQLAEQLRASERRYHEFIENSPDAFWEYEVGQRVTLVNQAALDIIGYTREEVEGKTFAGITIESDESIRELGEAVRREGAVKDWRFRIKTKQGAIKTLNLSARLVKEDGKPDRFQLTFRDVTARVKIEQELQVLYNLGQRLSSGPDDMRAMLEDACRLISTLTTMETVAIYLVDTDRLSMDLVAHCNLDPALAQSLASFPLLPDVLKPGFPTEAVPGVLEYFIVTKKPLAVEDVPGVSAWNIGAVKESGYQSGIGAPLRFGDEVYGVLLVGSRAPRGFERRDLELIETIALRLATMLRNKQLLLRMERKVKELGSLARVGDLLSRSPGSEHALTETAREIEHAFAADSAIIMLEKGGALRWAASSSALSRPTPKFLEHQRRILENAQPLCVNDSRGPEADAGQQEWLREVGVQAYIAAPLVSGSHSIGVLFVGQSAPRHWTDEEVRLAGTFANQIAGDIQQGFLLEELQSRLHELEVFADMSDLASSMVDERVAIDLTLDATKDLPEVDVAGVHLLDGDHFRIGRLRGAPPPTTPLELTPLVRQILDSNDPFVFDSEEPSPLDTQASERMRHIGARSIMVMRLSVSTGPLGLVTAASRSGRVWQPSEKLALKAIASQAAVAIINARAYHEQLERARQLKLLVALGEACAANARLDNLLRTVTDKVRQMLGAPFASIRLVTGDVLSGRVAAGLGEDQPTPGPVAMHPAIRRILDSQEPWPIADLALGPALPPEYTAFLKGNGVRGALLVPVVVKGKAEALLGVYFTTPHTWSEQEIQFVQAICHTVALSLERARLFDSLEQEKHDMAMTLDSVFSGVFTTDRAGVIQTWNRAAALMTGLSQDQVQGRQWREFARIGENEPDDLIFEAMENRRVVFGVQTRKIVKADGGAIPAAEAAAPLYDVANNVRGAVGAFWDRTKETQAERMKLEFLTLMSHELRNSLTVVMSMAGLLRDPKVRGETRERAIQVTGRQVDRLRDFANKFLDFESEHFREQPELSPVELSPLIQEAVDAAWAGHPGVEIRTPDGQWRVLAEPERLRTALLNLLENAAKYAFGPQPIEVRVAQAEGHRVEVSVHNWGPVIRPEDQEHIFERGYRAHLTGPDGRPVSGTGIGLWLVKAQLLECGSVIQVSSDETEGTSFRFTLSEAQNNEQEQRADPYRRRRPGRGRRPSRRS